MGSDEQRPVLVTGAGGFLGSAVVRALGRHGAAVRALIRDPAKAREFNGGGAEPVRGDVLDPEAVDRAIAGCRAAVHLAANPSTAPDDPELLRRVRIEGARNLLRAAKARGVPRVVIGSGFWVYAGSADSITERSRLEPVGESRNNFDAEEAARDPAERGAVETLVVRPGMVYGNGAWFASVRQAIEDGSYRVIDGGRNRWSFVDRDDAGEGFVTVVDRGTPGEAYDLVDGAPAPWGEFAAFLAERLGRPPPPSISATDAAMAYGPIVARHLAANRALTGAKLRGLGWSPRYASYRDGIRALLAKGATE